jgi:translation elongation factor EF-Ts
MQAAGDIAMYIHSAGKIGVMVEVSCESELTAQSYPQK